MDKPGNRNSNHNEHNEHNEEPWFLEFYETPRMGEVSIHCNVIVFFFVTVVPQGSHRDSLQSYFLRGMSLWSTGPFRINSNRFFS